MSVSVLHDGVPSAAPEAQSRALHYGDGVFRTLLCHDTQLVDWPLHRQKLVDDCATLRLDPPDEPELLADLHRLAAAHRSAVLKIIVARRAGARGYRPSGRAAERWVSAHPLPPLPAQAYCNGIAAAISDVCLSEQPLLAGVKHLNRLDQVLASDGWPDDVAESLMCRVDGALVCGTRSNLFVVRDGVLLTPQLVRCGVAGIMRRKILECAQGMTVAQRQTDIHVPDLLAADEAFICNAVIGIWPLRRVLSRQWPAPGPLTRRLMAAIAHPHVPEQLA
jgi:4-amino-4-deoxychorismate lyase